MLLHKCRKRGCNRIINGDEIYCDKHKGEELLRYRDYKKRKGNDEEYKKRNDFYNSKEWTRLRDYIRSKYFGMCVVCWAKDKVNELHTIHHIEEVSENWDKRLDTDNLIPLCSSCHRKVHIEYKKSKEDKKKMQRILFDLINKFNEELKDREV